MVNNMQREKIRKQSAESHNHKNTNMNSALSSSSGFTLLELLISIALFGIIIVIVIGAMRLGIRSVESGEKKIESLERMRNSFNIIDSQIQSMIPLTYDADGERKYYFKGEREFMQFSTNYSVWGGEKGYVIATYSVILGESGKQVLYISENVIGLADSRNTKLFDSFETIYFEYFFKDPTEEEGKWVDEWTDDLSIPGKIRVHFIKGANDFSMIIPMRVSQSSGMTGSGFRDEE